MISVIQRQLERVGIEVRRAGYQPWQQDPTFGPAFESMRQYSLLSKDRCFSLFQYARQLSRLGVAMAEVGVYRGGSASLIAQAAPNCDIHLFDTFDGMPSVDSSIDRHRPGDFSDTSVASVKQFLRDRENIRIHPGVFPASAEGIDVEEFSFVHVDCDLYDAVSSCLDFFFPRLVLGGMIVVDDYGWVQCPGVMRAVSEFTQRYGLTSIITARYQSALVKLDVPGESVPRSHPHAVGSGCRDHCR